MRIIGGRLKGKVITPPADYAARPTTDFAKEALFNILDNEYEFEERLYFLFFVPILCTIILKKGIFRHQFL